MPRKLTPLQAMQIIAERMEKRADVLEQVRLDAFNPTVHELRRFAGMVLEALED